MWKTKCRGWLDSEAGKQQPGDRGCREHKRAVNMSRNPGQDFQHPQSMEVEFGLRFIQVSKAKIPQWMTNLNLFVVVFVHSHHSRQQFYTDKGRENLWYCP